MFGWIVVAIPGIPMLWMVGREVVSNAVFWVWMGIHDQPQRRALPASEAMVVDGEVVPAGELAA